ncbi:MAG TPA: efflux RND transporter periplasmic adaptor subunit [Candidatus Sulfopaludibacter sp.]|nr:efflux RND transporter periplasmic adaptor subunit [Candidatus Sulfopaludibacter sp.]
MKKWLLLLPLVAAAVIAWGIVRKNAPPEVSFTRVRRQTLVSTLPTNGKAEPIEWEAVHAGAAGLVSRLAVQEGQTVSKGAVLVELTDPSLQADIEAAQAKVSEARIALGALQEGGKPSELADIDNSVTRAQFELQKAQKEYDTLKRLQAKQAVTAVEVQAEADKVRQYEIEIAGLQKRRGTLVGKSEIDAARARLLDAETALKLANDRAAQGVVRAPLGGEVYGLAVRRGAYLNVGDLVANIGHLEKLRVRVYVDEPLLGRVAPGQPVSIRWEALPGKSWQGTVDRMPTAIQALGSRQVGEVVCTIENPGRDLIPGTNVDAEIRTAVAENALVIPKETLHHDASGDYVFALKGDTVERRAVKTGNSTVTQVQVVEGLADTDSVALPGETQLKNGDRVAPQMK